MKLLEVGQKYSAARRIFNSLLGVSSGDETLRLMFDILREIFIDPQPDPGEVVHRLHAGLLFL